MGFQEISKGVVKRKERRVLGLFIDGTGLDRATRRIKRKVDMTNLVRGVTSGTPPVVARYYTLIPYEDDSRQRAFLDAVARAGLDVIVKRLPPKGVSRQVSVDVEMAADILAFSRGFTDFRSVAGAQMYGYSEEQEHQYQGGALPSALPFNRRNQPGGDAPRHGENSRNEKSEKTAPPEVLDADDKRIKRIITIVCPSRELAYPVSLVKEMGADTVTADFGQFNSGDILKSAAKWIDLSDSETIWRD